MANRTLIKGAEAACPTATGTASTATARLVTVVEEADGTVVGSFTMPGNTVEYVEKDPSYAIFAAHASVLGAKAGFTN